MTVKAWHGAGARPKQLGDISVSCNTCEQSESLFTIRRFAHNDRVAVAAVSSVVISGTSCERFDATMFLKGSQTAGLIRLIEISEGIAQVGQFGDHCTLQFDHTYHHAEDKNCRDKDHFSRQDYAAFVVPQ